jgi:hypothetical protein
MRVRPHPADKPRRQAFQQHSQFADRRSPTLLETPPTPS